MAGFWDTLFGGGAEKEAADKNRALYTQYGTDANKYLDTGLTNSTGALSTAKSEFAPLSAMYNQGATMYGNALGLNGASGNAAANAAFTTAPGYQQGINAGIDVLNRRRAAAGMANSGNADLDALQFGQNAQNQQYNSWLSNLSGLNNNALTTAGALSGIDTGLANLYQGDASNRVGVAGNVTSGDAQANNLQAQGEANGAKNLLGGVLGLGSLAVGGLGGMGGGSMLSSLGNAFGFGGGGGIGSTLGGMGITYGMPGTAGSNLYGPVRY